MITISIVLYQPDLNQITRTINSVLNSDIELKLYLIDNSPSDELKRFALLDDRINYIFNNKNDGFGAGHNVVIGKNSNLGKYHLVLNPDVTFNPDVLRKLVDFMDQKVDVGMCMPKILYPDGKIQYVAKMLPTPMDWIGRFFAPSKKWIEKRNYRFEMRFSKYDKIMDVPYLSGCFMLIRSSVIPEVGLFDEGIFMYGEDTDLTRRIHKKYRTVFYPEVEVVHEFNKGSHKNLRLFWIHVKAAIYYFNKWGWFVDHERRIINKRIENQFR